MLTVEEIAKYKKEIETDISYFNKIEFKDISEKFERDLKIINALSKELYKNEI